MIPPNSATPPARDPRSAGTGNGRHRELHREPPFPRPRAPHKTEFSAQTGIQYKSAVKETLRAGSAIMNLTTYHKKHKWERYVLN